MYTGGIRVIKFQFVFFLLIYSQPRILKRKLFFFPPLLQQSRKIEIGDKRMEECYFLNRYEGKQTTINNLEAEKFILLNTKIQQTIYCRGKQSTCYISLKAFLN